MIALTSLERSDSAQRSISWRIWARSLALFFTGMIVSFISPWAVYAYCARHLLAVDGMVLQRSLFLSSVTTGGRSVQGILIAIMMADPVHKRAVAPARRFLPVFLPAERGQVEIVVRSGQQISAANVARVGVKHVFTVS